MTRNWKHSSTLALHPTFSLSKSAHSDEAETSLKLETIPRTTVGACTLALGGSATAMDGGKSRTPKHGMPIW